MFHSYATLDAIMDLLYEDSKHPQVSDAGVGIAEPNCPVGLASVRGRYMQHPATRRELRVKVGPQPYL